MSTEKILYPKLTQKSQPSVDVYTVEGCRCLDYFGAIICAFYEGKKAPGLYLEPSKMALEPLSGDILRVNVDCCKISCKMKMDSDLKEGLKHFAEKVDEICEIASIDDMSSIALETTFEYSFENEEEAKKYRDEIESANDFCSCEPSYYTGGSRLALKIKIDDTIKAEIGVSGMFRVGNNKTGFVINLKFYSKKEQSVENVQEILMKMESSIKPTLEKYLLIKDS